jgi:hypothetical protein
MRWFTNIGPLVSLVLFCFCCTVVLAVETGKSRKTKTAPIGKAAVWDTKPFDPSVERLPPKYIGHSLKTIYERTNALKL